jgi:hypothetical protein
MANDRALDIHAYPPGINGAIEAGSGMLIWLVDPMILFFNLSCNGRIFLYRLLG